MQALMNSTGSKVAMVTHKRILLSAEIVPNTWKLSGGKIIFCDSSGHIIDMSKYVLLNNGKVVNKVFCDRCYYREFVQLVGYKNAS